MRYSTISALGSFSAFTTASTDYLLLDPAQCSGGEDHPVRTTVEQKPGADGVFVFPAYNDAQIITLAGPLIIASSATESGYFSALDTLLAALKTALDALKASPGNLVHSGGTLSVSKYGPLDTSVQAALMTVTFSVIVND